jgi:hypothetical protein
MDTPWSRARKLRSIQQEKRIGRMEGGQPSVNSGRFWRWKRDGRIYEFLIEARTNEKPTVKSYRIDSEEFLKLRKEAIMQAGGLKPAMQVTIGDLDLMVIQLQDFHDMYLRLIQLEESLGDEIETLDPGE